MARGARALTEAALHARVDNAVGDGKRLQVLLVNGRVGVQDDARVEQVLGIEKLLDVPHDGCGLGAPLHFDVGCHVASCAVLGLEGALELDNELAEVVHHAAIAVDLRVACVRFKSRHM